MHKFIKIALAGLFTGGAVYFFWDEQSGWGVLLTVLAVFTIVFYLRNEFILLAFWHLRNQNMDKANKWLGKITNYQSQLIRKQWGYYHYMLAITAGQNNIGQAEKNMKKALDLGLSFKHDRALANLTLAGSALSKGKKKEAQRLLATAKELDTNNMLSEQIKMMSQQMKKVNVGRNLQNPAMRRRGKYF